MMWRVQDRAAAARRPAHGALLLRVLWNLRLLGLFLIGPAIGVALVGPIFGLPGNLQLAAGAMFLLSLGLFGILFKSEWQRLARQG